MKKLVSIVSICALMVSIGAFSVFANDDVPNNESPVQYITHAYNLSLPDSTDRTIQFVYTCRASDPEVIDISDGYSTTPGYVNTQVKHMMVKSTLHYYILIRNYNTVDTITISSPYLLLNTNCGAYTTGTTNGSNQQTSIDIFTFGMHDYNNCLVESYSNQLYVYPSNDHRTGYRIVIAPGESFTMTFDVDVGFNYEVPIDPKNQTNNDLFTSPYTIGLRNASIVTSTLTLEAVDDTWNYGETYNLYDINANVQSILDQYTANAQNAQAVTDGTQTNEQTLSNIHQNEDTWFTQNDQALTATGMDDFNYSPQVMSGLTVISDQFNQLWNAIGQWNFVYTFSMMIGLVVLILRHNPQRKKSSSGGKTNATGS